jgi:type IV pilus assembly protein PilM
LAMVIRNALTRLTSDIARTTNYYRSQHGGNSPVKVYLAGGGANLPYTLEFLHEKLGLPVEFFNPLSKLAISKDVNTAVLQQEAHMMGELVGLGLRGIGKSSINIDLVPAAVEQLRDADRRKPFLIAAAAILIAGFSVWAVMKQLAASKANDELRTITEIRDNLAPHEAKIRSLLKKEEELNKVATAYTDIQEDHTYWFDLLTEVREAFASDSVWLTEVTPIYGFAPNTSPESKEPAAKLQPVIPENFANNIAGSNSLISNPPVVAEVEDRSRSGRRNSRNNKPQAPPKVVANAILIRGFWRENPRSQNAVSDLLKNLKENSTVFKFTMPDPKGKPDRKTGKINEIPLSDEDLLMPSAQGADDDLGFTFELKLPLAKPVAVK